jgi:WD40 repeat protein
MPNDNLESDTAHGVPRQEHFADRHPLLEQPAIEQSAIRRRYDGFISYSHAADRTLSRPVQRCLETLAKPLYQRKALWIFRDEPSLAATESLWPTIQGAMESSRYFILLASPDAARSPWVRRELTWWMHNRDSHTLLIALTAGAIAWDPTSDNFAWDSTDALPDELSGWFRQEPLWVDLRWTRDQAGLSPRDPRLQDAVAALASPIRGIPKDELVGLDIVLHRRTVRLTQIAVTLLVLLTIAAFTGAVVAVNQRDSARRQTRLAESRALVNAAISTAPTRLDLSLLMAQRAVTMHPAPDTRAALLAAVVASPHLARFIQESSPVTDIAVRPNGGAAVGHGDGSIGLFDSDFRHERPLAGTGRAAIAAVGISATSQLVAAIDRQGTVGLWSAADRSLRWQRQTGLTGATSTAVAPDGRAVAVTTRSGHIVVLDGHDGRILSQDSLGLPGTTPQSLRFLDARRLLVGDETGEAQLWTVSPYLRRVAQHGQLSLADELLAWAWSGDGRTYAITKSSHQTDVFDGTSGRLLGTGFASVPPTAGPMAIDDQGTLAAFIYHGELSVYDRSPQAGAAGRSRVDLPGFSSAQALSFSHDGRWLLAVGQQTIAVFDLRQLAALATELPPQLGDLPCRACVTTMAVDPKGRSVVWTDATGVMCWDLRHARQGAMLQGSDGVSGVAFTPDGSALAVSTGDGLATWPTPEGCPEGQSANRLPSGAYSQRLWAIDAARMLTWDQVQAPQLVDLVHGRTIRTYGRAPTSSEYLGDLAVSSDARTIATTTSTGDIVWFDVDTGAHIGTAHTGTDNAGALAFLPASRRVARTTATTVQLWDPDGRQVGQFDGTAQQLRFSSDGTLLFGLDNDEVLRVWDVSSGQLLGTMQALPLADEHGNQVAGGAQYGGRTAMALGPDGKLWLAAANAHPTAWTFATPILNRLACQLAGRSLNRDEWRRYVGTQPPTNLSCTPS